MTIRHEEWLARERARALDALPIPHEYKGKTWDDYQVTDANADAVEGARKWLRNGKKYLTLDSPMAGVGLVFVGPPGTGKTMLASILAQELVRRSTRNDTVWFTSMEGFNRDRLRKMEIGPLMDGPSDDGTFVSEWVECDRRVQHAYRVPVLVLDDIGQENTTEHLARMVNELLRSRYANARPTIVTSNVHPDDWGDKFKNPSLGSFVHQACHVLNCDGEDQRAGG